MSSYLWWVNVHTVRGAKLSVKIRILLFTHAIETLNPYVEVLLLTVNRAKPLRARWKTDLWRPRARDWRTGKFSVQIIIQGRSSDKANFNSTKVWTEVLSYLLKVQLTLYFIYLVLPEILYFRTFESTFKKTLIMCCMSESTSVLPY